MKRQVKYEPHPVSRERKLILQAQGFKIVDAKFAPPAKQEPALLKRPKLTLPSKSSEGVQ